MDTRPSLLINGQFTLKLPSGDLRAKNSATLEGLYDHLNTIFLSGGTTKSWYVGFISNDGFTGVSVNDTSASHSGWTEFTGYTFSGGGRVGPMTVTPSRSSFTGFVVFATSTQVTFTQPGTIKGLFLTSSATKESTGGILYATAVLFPPASVVPDDVGDVSYQWTISGNASTKDFPNI